jgi:hypothetical protein
VARRDKSESNPSGIPTNCSSHVEDLFFTTADQFKQFLRERGGEDEDFQPEEIAKNWGDWALKKYLEHGYLSTEDVHTPS